MESISWAVREIRRDPDVGWMIVLVVLSSIGGVLVLIDALKAA